MVINETIFNVDCLDIIRELQQELALNKIALLQTITDTPDNVMVACPYHKGGQEKRPSMGIKKSDGTCHCFACSTVVSLPQLISHCFGDESEIGATGWNWLLRNFLTVSVENRKDIDLDFSRFSRVALPVHDYVSEEELDSYRYIHPYMRERRLTDEVIEIFDIGYDSHTDCITFPIRDISGRTLFVARRSVHCKFFNYPSKAEKPLYGIYEIYTQSAKSGGFPGEIIICESMLDALTAWVYGKYAVALNGLGTALQFKQLRELPCRKYILATDADKAGMEAREKIKKNVPNKIITEYKWDLSRAKDLNDMDLEMFKNLKEIY